MDAFHSTELMEIVEGKFWKRSCSIRFPSEILKSNAKFIVVT